MRGYNPTITPARGAVGFVLSAVAFGAAFFTANDVYAQDSILEEITVTATRRETALQDVPISVATMSGERLNILFAGSEDILALSGRVPGLYAESSNGRAAPRFYMRGLGNIDFDLAASQPVSIVMDEVVMENVVLKSFPLFDLQNVEVIRGPQGTLFGRNTTAGIIKINSRRPEQENSGYVRGSIATHTTINLEGGLGGSLGDNWSGRVSGIVRSRDNWIDNGFTGESNVMGDYNDIAGRAQLLYEPTDTFRGLLLFQARQLDGTSSIFRANVFTTGSNKLNQNYDRGTVYYDGGDNNPQKYTSYGTTVNLEFDIGTTTLTSITSYQDADGSSRGDIDGGVVDFTGTATVPPGITFDPMAPVFGGTALTFPGTITVPSVTEDGADTKQITQEFRLASDPDNSMRWQAGLFYFDSELTVETDSFASFGFDGRQVNTIVRHDNTAWALFGQLEYDATDNLMLMGGLRYTDDKRDFRVDQFGALWTDIGIPEFLAPPTSLSDDNISWELAANYGVGDSSTVFGRVASGFRAQTIQGRDVAFLETPTTAGAETITSFEFGYKGDLADNRFRLNTTFYYYKVDDMQLSVIGGASNVNQVINADKGTAIGLDLDAEWLATDNLLITGGIAVTQTQIEDPTLGTVPCGSGMCTPTDPIDPADASRVLLDGNPFPRVPDFSANLTLRYSTPTGNDAELFFFTDWIVNGRINMPLYESLEFVHKNQFEGGLKAGYHSFSGWELAVFGRNITDENNTLGFIDFSNNTGFVNEGRVWGIEGSLAFGD